jgi:hypothetical protein
MSDVLSHLPEELQAEILLRLPLHHHNLLRASQVCRLWRRLINHSDFLGHFRERHNGGIPLLIGVYHNNCFPCNTRFTLTGADCSATSIFQCRESWRILDCRHGRVLFLDADLPALIVWDPMTARSDRITMPSDLTVYDYDKPLFARPAMTPTAITGTAVQALSWWCSLQVVRQRPWSAFTLRWLESGAWLSRAMACPLGQMFVRDPVLSSGTPCTSYS